MTVQETKQNEKPKEEEQPKKPISDFEKEERLIRKLEKIGPALGNFFRAIRRGWQGLSQEEDVFSGLLNVKDIRERTRLSEHDVFGHSAMRLIASWYPEEMGFWENVAEMEDRYMISLEGEQRKEAILMQRAKAEISMVGQPMTVQMPKVETKPPEEAKPEKKGIFHR